MMYCLKYYDNYYHDYRIAYHSTLYQLLECFSLWIDNSDEWYLYKLCGTDIALIGRSAKAAQL